MQAPPTLLAVHALLQDAIAKHAGTSADAAATAAAAAATQAHLGATQGTAATRQLLALALLLVPGSVEAHVHGAVALLHTAAPVRCSPQHCYCFAIYSSTRS